MSNDIDINLNSSKIYHGSNVKVENPKIIKGRFTKDFGYVFYCTIREDQAKR